MGEFNHEDKKTMKHLLRKKVAKFYFFTAQVFEERYVIGKLINILSDDEETSELINQLSQELTDKTFTASFGGEELIKPIQTLRPTLIKLYGKVSSDELEDWFESE